MACWLLVGSRTRTRRALPRLLSRGQELADQGSPGLLGTNRAAVHWGVRFQGAQPGGRGLYEEVWARTSLRAGMRVLQAKGLTHGMLWEIKPVLGKGGVACISAWHVVVSGVLC